MTNAEKLAKAREELAAIVKRIETYEGGDRAPSPPVSLIHEEQRLRGIVDFYELAEREREARDAKKPAATVVTAVAAKVPVS